MTEAPIVEVLELGPGSVRRLWPELEVGADHEEVSAAIGGLDDPVVLIGDRPVDVSSLWRRIAGSLCRTGARPPVVVHPGWWSEVRVEHVVEGLGLPSRRAGSVVAMSRAQFLADAGRGGICDSTEVLIEIDVALIAISEGAMLAAVLGRTTDVDHIVDRVLRCERRSAAVLVDAPVGVPGASDYADMICEALSGKGVRASLVSIERIVAETMSARGSCQRRAEDPQRRRFGRVRFVAAAALAAVLCVGGFVFVKSDRLRHSEPRLADGAIVLAEGRISARIPLAWKIEKLTTGPGSRRIRATSPESGGGALHVTQSYIPGQTLAGTAEMLAGALAGEAPGVFRDFNAHGLRAGRSGVSYQEVRDARVVDWFVVVDGATRIGIGCESRSGGEHEVRAACDGAIESAHELNGTDLAN